MSQPKPHWGLLGGETLLGQEIRDLVAQRKLPIQLRAFSTGDIDRVLTKDDEGELAILEPFTEAAAAELDVLILAGLPESHNKAHALAGLLPLVDLTGALEEIPGARVRAPLIQAQPVPEAQIEVLAHPGALALARFLTVLQSRFPLVGAVVTALEPVSMYDRPGVDELHKQTLALLAFQPIPQTLFDTQVAYNLKPRFGEEAKASLSVSAQRMEQHLASLLGPSGIPLPSLQVVHAPVFHGYSLSVWTRFGQRPSLNEVSALLTAEGFDLRGPDVEPPSNTSVAGEGSVAVGEVSHDRNDPSAIWFWLAFDNVRIVAENALLVAGMATRKGS